METRTPRTLLLPALLSGWLLLGGAVRGQGPVAGAATATDAPLIRAIELRSDVSLQLERTLDTYLALEVGQPLTEEAIHRTLGNLYASGRATRIALYRRPVSGGVEVIVSLWSSVLVDEVRLEGTFAGLKPAELQARIPQEAGQPLIESRVIRGDYQIEELYAQRGYLDARVALAFSEPDARNRVTVTYRITPGERATVGEVELEGDLGPFSVLQLLEEIRSRAGQPFRERTAEEDAERLRSWLIGRGYRTARVELSAQDRSPETGRMKLTYRLEVGPEVVTRIEGAEREKLKKKGLLPFLGEEGYDEALLLQAVDRLKAYYQRQGHYRVEVDADEDRRSGEGESEPETLGVTIAIDPGPVYTLERVSFEGNASYSAQRLSELIETSAGRLLGLADGRLVDEVLAADLRNLRSFYALEGFVGTRVGPPRVEIEDERRIFLTLPIEEGRRRVVGEIRFEGVESLAPVRLRQRLSLTEGSGYNETLLEDSLDALRARYDELGYTRAQVSVEASWNDDRSVVDLTFQVLEGSQQRLGSILVTGNRKTRTAVILGALEISSGDPVSGPRLLDMERNLYRLGIFSRVEVEFLPADLGAVRRDVLVRVKEGRTRSLIFEAGYNSEDDARGLIGLSLRNVLGRNYNFQTDLRLSFREERFRLSFEQPRLGDIPFGLLYELFRFEEGRESYDAIRRVGRVELVPLAQTELFTLAVDFREIETEEFAGPLVIEADAEAGEDSSRQQIRPGVLSPLEQNPDGTSRAVRVASLIPGFRWDRRDDPVEPTRGWLSGVQVQYSFPALGTKTEYLKLFAQHGHYVSLGGRRVLALGTRLGAIEPLEIVEGAGGERLLSVPLDERFFAGGRSTHRGFSRFALGIDGETRLREEDRRAPIGGNGLVLLNLELRFPLFSSVGGAVFFDSGNVWRDWRDVDSGFRNALGVGVRYLSPIGPLRVDVGYKLDRKPAESDFELHFSFGNPF